MSCEGAGRIEDAETLCGCGHRKCYHGNPGCMVKVEEAGDTRCSCVGYVSAQFIRSLLGPTEDQRLLQEILKVQQLILIQTEATAVTMEKLLVLAREGSKP